MKYENMPKGRNKDICVRCGKRANFADRLLSDVQYDLLCLAETTSSGYMTHGNVKLCGKCMSELLMWLDADDFCSYGEREGEPLDYCKKRNCVWWSRSLRICLAEQNGLVCKCKSGKE